jgi:hypothetical protein
MYKLKGSEELFSHTKASVSETVAGFDIAEE